MIGILIILGVLFFFIYGFFILPEEERKCLLKTIDEFKIGMDVEEMKEIMKPFPYGTKTDILKTKVKTQYFYSTKNNPTLVTIVVENDEVAQIKY